jgi:hypothetical protein
MLTLVERENCSGDAFILGGKIDPSLPDSSMRHGADIGSSIREKFPEVTILGHTHNPHHFANA